MLNVEHLEGWRGEDVLDCGGERIGKVEEVFCDVRSSEPVLLSVKSGLLGRHVRLIPLAGASVGRDYVRVAYGNEDVERAEYSSEREVLGREVIERIAAIYGLDLAEGVELESARAIAERRAEADKARRHADELGREAERKGAEHDDAQRREEGAAAAADQAKREAEQASRAAAEARQAAPAAEPPESPRQTD